MTTTSGGRQGSGSLEPRSEVTNDATLVSISRNVATWSDRTIGAPGVMPASLTGAPSTCTSCPARWNAPVCRPSASLACSTTRCRSVPTAISTVPGAHGARGTEGRARLRCSWRGESHRERAIRSRTSAPHAMRPLVAASWIFRRRSVGFHGGRQDAFHSLRTSSASSSVRAKPRTIFTAVAKATSCP